MVLGSGNGGSGTRCASGRVGGSLFGTGQQPPSVHADAVGQDCTWTHQHTDPVQRSKVPAGFQHPGSALPLILPQRAQLGAALHEGGEDSWGGAGGGRGSLQALSPQHLRGDVSGTETEVGRVQASRPPLLTAPHAARHQQTHRLPWPVTTPKASTALLTGVSLQGMRGGQGGSVKSIPVAEAYFNFQKTLWSRPFMPVEASHKSKCKFNSDWRVWFSDLKLADGRRGISQKTTCLQEKHSTVINTYSEIDVEVFFSNLASSGCKYCSCGGEITNSTDDFFYAILLFFFSAKIFCNFYMCTLFFIKK